MAGLDGRRHGDRAVLLVMSGLLASACQRLEYVSDDDGGSSEPNAEWNEPPEQEIEEEVPPPGEAICAVEGVCECYGALEQDLCDLVVRQSACGWDTTCIALDPVAREDCLVARYCDADGHLEGNTVFCDVELSTCAGACDLDPAACDGDGDGVVTFACSGGATECAQGQFCVEHGDDWNCDDDCSNCGPSSDGGYECMWPSPTCQGGTLEEQRKCIGDLVCEFFVEGYFGHRIVCGDNECHG